MLKYKLKKIKLSDKIIIMWDFKVLLNKKQERKNHNLCILKKKLLL